jgi:hypothetical protein
MSAKARPVANAASGVERSACEAVTLAWFPILSSALSTEVSI